MLSMYVKWHVINHLFICRISRNNEVTFLKDIKVIKRKKENFQVIFNLFYKEENVLVCNLFAIKELEKKHIIYPTRKIAIEEFKWHFN